MAINKCAVPRCKRPTERLNLCRNHYDRFRKYGTLKPSPKEQKKAEDLKNIAKLIKELN